MGAVTLSTQEQIVIDVSELTLKEWRDFMSPNGPASRDDEIVSKCTGIPVKRLTGGDILYNDYRRLVTAIVKAAREPLADPNSASASTSA